MRDWDVVRQRMTVILLESFLGVTEEKASKRQKGQPFHSGHDFIVSFSSDKPKKRKSSSSEEDDRGRSEKVDEVWMLASLKVYQEGSSSERKAKRDARNIVFDLQQRDKVSKFKLKLLS